MSSARDQRLADFRRVFADVVMARAESHDPELRAAFARVPRHEFVGPGPWHFTEHGDRSSSDDPALVYQDVGMGLVPERGIPTGQPSLHARCIARAHLNHGERVTHIGAGSGYYTAILAELVGATGSVVGYELDSALTARAAANLKGWPWARIEAASGAEATPAASDLVYVSAGVERLPTQWLSALRPGGRLIVPLSPAGEEGAVLLVRDIDLTGNYAAEFLCRARFVPCVGARDDNASADLARAFRAGGLDAVRSLRLDPERADASAWFCGNGFWLSTRAN